MKKISPVAVKLFVIGLIIGVLCITNCMIGGKLDDREGTYRIAQESICESAGGNFVVKNAFVGIPYEKTYTTSENNKTITKTSKGWNIVPAEKISYDTNLISEIRTLGIYHSPVFTGDLQVKASFKIKVPQNTSTCTYNPHRAVMIIPLASTSLTEKPVFQINKLNYETYFNSYDSDFENDASGIACRFNASTGEVFNFSTTLKIRGASRYVLRLDSAETKLNVKSDWKSPGFTSFSYLPDTRNITDEGFSASWNIPFASTSAHYTVGFDFVEPVELYKKLGRAQNYAFLFIIVPFIILFLFEIFASITLHPMHYLLSGAASVIFFLLLLSISEHLSFEKAYLIGALASGCLVSLYVMSITKKIKLGGIMSLLFVLLYSYLYFCLQSEDYALLMGSVFAFTLLASIMFITRKVNWSNLKKTTHTDLM